jgi:hypothetical protein
MAISILLAFILVGVPVVDSKLWLQSTMKDGSINYSSANCAVSIKKDKTAMMFSAVDNSWPDGPLAFANQIVRNASGETNSTRDAIVIIGSRAGTKVTAFPDVFLVRCLNRAKKLPIEVRRFIQFEFNNAYQIGGIGIDPDAIWNEDNMRDYTWGLEAAQPRRRVCRKPRPLVVHQPHKESRAFSRAAFLLSCIY